MLTTVDNFPQPNTQWFKNWFYPVYNQYGGAAVLNKFFQLLANHFPKDANRQYTKKYELGQVCAFLERSGSHQFDPCFWLVGRMGNSV